MGRDPSSLPDGATSAEESARNPRLRGLRRAAGEARAAWRHPGPQGQRAQGGPPLLSPSLGIGSARRSRISRREADCSIGSIYHHFGSKEGIAEELFLDGISQLQRRRWSESDPEVGCDGAEAERLRAVVNATTATGLDAQPRAWPAICTRGTSTSLTEARGGVSEGDSPGSYISGGVHLVCAVSWRLARCACCPWTPTCRSSAAPFRSTCSRWLSGQHDERSRRSVA